MREPQGRVELRVSVGNLWRRMSPEFRERIGMLLLASIISDLSLKNAPSTREDHSFFRMRSADAAIKKRLIGVLSEILDASFEEGQTVLGIPDLKEVLGIPDLKELEIRCCRVCGCTDVCACMTEKGPCWWVSEDLCSGCSS